ncbi:DUF1501 domain-containing protein [Endomicrobium sp. AH-315-J14]|nr:DUF1501 domain-containing protein [Endomicrobium sp. AH-315-J14]
MERRNFIKLCSIAGLGVASSGMTINLREAWGASPKCYVFLRAGGGWDCTMVCDPKGGDPVADTGINPEFLPGDIPNSGNIKYAPVANNEAFFTRFSDRLLIINGIDTQTNGHDTGTRNTGSGDLKDGFPAFAALAAATLSENQPLAFITNGGYDETAGTVGATRFGNLNAIQSLIYPNRTNPGNENSGHYHTQSTWETITEARQARLARLRDSQRLPKIKGAQSLLYTSRLGQGSLKQLLEFLPEDLGNGLDRQANIGLAAYKAGLTTSINMSMGGFDSHSQNFNRQNDRVGQLLDGATYVMDRAEELGIADEVVLVVCSEFGRTPNINSGNGKDHWAVNSMMMMGPGIKGNRVVGGTDEGQHALKIDPLTLEPSESGVPLLNSHIHDALRRHAGIENHPVIAPFKLSNEESLPILG